MAIQVCEVRASIVEKVKRKTLKCLSTTKTKKNFALQANGREFGKCIYILVMKEPNSFHSHGMAIILI